MKKNIYISGRNFIVLSSADNETAVYNNIVIICYHLYAGYLQLYT